jgi:hypothetical protein
VGRPLIGTRPLTNAEHQARYRAKHGRKLRPGNAARQRRWRDRRADEVTVEVRAARVAEEEAVVDPLYIKAVAILEERGETDLIWRLKTGWAYMALAVRQQLATGKGYRFWLKD